MNNFGCNVKLKNHPAENISLRHHIELFAIASVAFVIL